MTASTFRVFRLRVWHLALAGTVVSGMPARAWACGASAGGVAGLAGCSLAEYNEATRNKWRVGASFAHTSTALRLDTDARFDQTRSAAVATLDHAPTPRWTFQLGAGALFDGRLSRDAEGYDLRPGLVVLAGASWRFLDADGSRPFVLFSGQLAYLTTRTELSDSDASSVAYNAFDLRVGPTVGWTFWQSVSPYLLGRLFGGPVFWRHQGEAVLGQDTHHYQLGAGVSVVIARRVDLFVEGSPLGEQAVSAGAGFAF
jgi:hypothetical protein